MQAVIPIVASAVDGPPHRVRRQVLQAAAALLLGAGCSARQPMRIGFMGGLSGRISDLGIGSRNGTQLALDDINAAGGLAGRQLELLVRDDEQNLLIAEQRLKELFALGVELVIGPVTSTMATPVVALANQHRIPVISPLAGANDFSGHDDHFFRVVADTATSARQQADALLRRGLRRIVTVADMRNPVFSRNWTESAAKRFTEGGGVVVPAVQFEAGPGLVYQDLARRIVDSGAEGAIIVASAADCAVLVQQVRRLQSRMFMALSAWAGTEEFPTLGGPALDGALVTQFFDRFNSTPRWLDFVTRYRQRFGDAPGFAAMNGYDALQMAAVATRIAGAPGLLAALGQVREFEGLQRKLRFDAYGDCVVPTYLTEVWGGRFVAAST